MAIDAAEIKRVKAIGCLHNRGTENFSIRVITKMGAISDEQNKPIS